MGLVPDLIREFIGRDSLVRLLTYAIRCHEVASVALLKLKPEDFDSATEYEFQVVWIAAKAYWEQYNETPSVQYLLDICPAIVRAQNESDVVLQQRVIALVQDIFAISDVSNVNYGKELLKAFLYKLFVSTVGQIGRTNDNANDVFSRIEGEFRKRHINDMYEIDPFDINENTSFGEPREPLGTSAIDLLMNGGTFSTDVIGIIGPTGGGKTTLALQIAGGCAARKQYVLYFTYETSPDELRPRLISCISRVARSALEGKTFGDLDESTKTQVKTAVDTCKTYVSLIDRSSEGWAPVEIEERIRQSIAAGRKPRLVVIDWIWIPAARAAAESTKRSKPERMYLNDLLDAYKGMAVKYKINFLILQQLSTEQAKRRAGAKPQWFNSAEAGSFSWLLSYCFAIGTADEAGYCWLVGSKARHSKKQDLVVQLVGEYNRFDTQDKDMVYKDRRGFVPTNKANSLNDNDDDESPALDRHVSKYEQNTDFY